MKGRWPLYIMLLLVGCGIQPAGTPTLTPVIPTTPVPTESPLPTETPLPVPTSTPTPARDAAALAEAIVQDYPAVDGSTSTLPLQRVIACKLFGVRCVWGDMILVITERAIVPDIFGDVPPELADMVWAIWHNGTHASYMNLLEGVVDFILVARPPSEDELQAARDRWIELEVMPVALDAFVFLVHTDNPVEGLTLETVRDIYAGRITRWSEVGGVDDVIHVYQRSLNSGNQELMEELVMQGTPMIEAPDMLMETMLGPVNVISGYPGDPNDPGDPLGIGYSVFYDAVFIYIHEHTRLLAIDGVPPTSESIAARTYPLWTEVYAVIRASTPANNTAVLLRDWLLTEAGQAAVAESGYVPLR